MHCVKGAVAGEESGREPQTTHMQPKESHLLQAFYLWFGSNQCTSGHAACPYCWYRGPNLLLHREIQFSSNYTRGPPVSNSGLGHLRGGSIRALGDGGEDLEIFRNLRAVKMYMMSESYCNADSQDLTIGKIL